MRSLFARTACLALFAISGACLLPAGVAARPSKLPPSILSPIRITCTSTPLAWSKVRSAAKPVPAGTITYEIRSSRIVMQVRLAPAREGIAWEAVRSGRTEEKGVVPLPAPRAGQPATLEVAVRRTGTPAAAGMQWHTLFSRFAPECEVGLVLTGKARPAKTARSEVLVRPQKQPDDGPTHSAAALPWLDGMKGYASALKQRGKARKEMVLYFRDPASTDCKDFDNGMLEACRANTLFDPMIKVRVNPKENAQAKALAARLGARTVPAMFLYRKGADRPKQVYPASGKKLMQPCELVAACEKVLGRKAGPWPH